MPSAKRTLSFLSCALSTALAVATLAFGMAADWSKTTLSCEGVSVSGSAVVTLSIFTGSAGRVSCPISQQSDDFTVIPQLVKTGGAPVVLHGLITGFCVVCLIFSASSIIIALYNSVSHPYGSCMGHVGIYICNGSSLLLSTVIICMYLSNVLGTEMIEGVVRTLPNSNSSLEFTWRSTDMEVGFYLLIPSVVFYILAIVLVCCYQHSAHTCKKEHPRPAMYCPRR